MQCRGHSAKTTFKPFHAVFGVFKFADLAVPFVGHMMTGDAVDGAIQNGLPERFTVGGCTQRGIYLKVGIVFRQIFIGKPKVIGSNTATDIETFLFCPANKLY